MAAPRQGVAPPDPREGEALPATAWTASSGPPPFMPTRKKGAVGRERGTSSAQRSRRRHSRGHSTLTSPRRGARRTHPHGGPLRALINRYSRPQGAPSGRTGRDPDAAGIAWGPRAACRRGDTQGRRPRRPPERSAGWPKFGGRSPPLGGASYSVSGCSSSA